MCIFLSIEIITINKRYKLNVQVEVGGGVTQEHSKNKTSVCLTSDKRDTYLQLHKPVIANFIAG